MRPVNHTDEDTTYRSILRGRFYSS